VRRVADEEPHGHGGQVPCTGGSVVVGQLYLHLLHFSPRGSTTPQGQLVGTGGHTVLLPTLNTLSRSWRE
jgi:hypothetical protein